MKCTAKFTTLAVIVLSFLGATMAQDSDAGAPPLRLPAGTTLTVRIDQLLSSDKNQPGDSFSATLTQPLVAQGIVVAQRGQTVLGRVDDVQKGKGFSGNSSIRISLTRVNLVDGQSVPIRTQLLVNRGHSSTGRDVRTVGTTTVAGAVIGSAIGRGEGAALGAATGATAGVIGVMMSKGYATVIYPESQLVFETVNAVSIDTSAAPQAFHAVDPNTYARNAEPQLQSRPTYAAEVAPRPVVVAAPPAVIYPEPYVYPYPVRYAACDPYWYSYCYGPRYRVYGPSYGVVFYEGRRYHRRYR